MNGEILLSDMTTFSVKQQERRLKKALEEEKKVSIEAERIVQWVKQESSRIDSSTIKSILNDNKEKD
jgi:nucleoid DNA-binding protein